jgi:hypothetical protein
MTKHLSACPKRQAVIAQAERRKAHREKLYHLHAQDAWGGDFWLELEIRGTATLKGLDHYLRAIWLECCGHMSRFSIGGWKGAEIAKSKRVEEVFRRGITLTHIYDFGTSSETLIRYVKAREGKPTTPHPIALMARNVQPQAICIECKRPAVWLCMECVIEDEIWGFLCQEHVESHPHEGYGEPIRIVNSPRLGMCGYERPADPPY